MRIAHAPGPRIVTRAARIRAAGGRGASRDKNLRRARRRPERAIGLRSARCSSASAMRAMRQRRASSSDSSAGFAHHLRQFARRPGAAARPSATCDPARSRSLAEKSASCQEAAVMCGTPRASRAMVALRRRWARAIAPDVSGSGRQPYQYTTARRRHQQNGYAQIDRPEQRSVRKTLLAL